jgi:hypothetical protein
MEHWRNIPTFPTYAISSYGNVKSIRTGKVLQSYPHRQRYGYLRVDLTRQGKRHAGYIHRLMYQTFVGSIPPGYHVHHADGNARNNALRNLRLYTPGQNAREATQRKINRQVVQLNLWENVA